MNKLCSTKTTALTHRNLLEDFPVSGVTMSFTPRKLIEGHDCKPEERQYHVKILDGNNKYICDGSLLENNWILTSGQCEKR